MGQNGKSWGRRLNVYGREDMRGKTPRTQSNKNIDLFPPTPPGKVTLFSEMTEEKRNELKKRYEGR